MTKSTTPRAKASAPGDEKVTASVVSENENMPSDDVPEVAAEAEINEHGVPVGVPLSHAQVQEMLRSMRATGVDVDPASEQAPRKRK